MLPFKERKKVSEFYVFLYFRPEEELESDSKAKNGSLSKKLPGRIFKNSPPPNFFKKTLPPPPPALKCICYEMNILFWSKSLL